MKLIVGNFKNKLDLNQTKTLLDQYTASFLNETNIGFCVTKDIYKNIDTNSFKPLAIYSNNIDLKEIDCSVFGKNFLIGHFDFRNKGETNSLILKKVKKLLKFGASVLLCVGDTIEDYNNNNSNKALKKQLRGLKSNDRLIIAYEPFYAIGSKNPAKLDEVEKNINFIKSLFYGKVQVLYGGSIDAKNGKEFLQSSFIDGVLVGRASLDIKAFSGIIKLR